MERRTLAPAPSDCSRARKEVLMARGVVMLLVAVVDARRAERGKGVLEARGCVRWMRLLRSARAFGRIVLVVASLVWLFE